MTDKFVTRRELDLLRAHLSQLREADQRALVISETKDLAALSLAREHQVYRDAQANELRAQINAERLLYVTRPAMEASVAKIEAELKPVLAFMAQQQGRSAGISALQATLMGLAGLLIAVLSVALVLAHH